MNRMLQFTLCLLLCAFVATAAQQEEFDQILAAIRQADRLIEEGKDRQAIAQYQLAQKTLVQFQKSYPDWDKQVVSFRLSYVNERLENWSGDKTSNSPATPDGTDDALQSRINYLERANGQYQFQLKQLHEENARLNTKLREALAIRPAVLEPAVVAESQARLEQLEKAHAAMSRRAKALEKELSEYPGPDEAKKNVQLLEETRKNLNQVILEAEELRRSNEVLRKEAATRPFTIRGGSEAMHREILAAQAAQQLAESEVVRLRTENENLNLRIASLEARFSTDHPARTGPGNPQLNTIDSARLALSQGKNADATRLLTEALKRDPSNLEMLYLMGRALMLQNKLDEAELSLKRVLELSPESGVTHFELARLYYAKDSTNPALARWHYHKALNLGFPRNTDFEKSIRWEQPGS